VAILGNVNGQAVDDIAAKFGTLLHGGAVTLPSERKEIQVPPAALAAFVGTYELQGIQVVITLEGDHLAAQVTDQPKIPLFAESETTFFFKVVDAVIEFDKGASPAAFLILRQNGREMRGTRKN
jgi:hypothetical protein